MPAMAGGCALLTNGLEWVGKKRNWSHGVVGSVLASVGTTLPETLVPLVAIFLLHSSQGKEIALGAILGAPLMLTTVALAVAGAVALLRPEGEGRKARFRADTHILRHDLLWFLITFSTAALASLIPSHEVRVIFALLLVGSYVHHVALHFREERLEEPTPPLLYFYRHIQEPSLLLCVIQTLLGLGAIVLTARIFVAKLEVSSVSLGIPPALLSLFLSPLATELPEMINASLWMKQGKDTLAIGNTTGAMLFQSSVLTAIGIGFTPWKLSEKIVLSVLTTFLAALFSRWALGRWEKKPFLLLFCGLFYLIYLVGAIVT